MKIRNNFKKAGLFAVLALLIMSQIVCSAAAANSVISAWKFEEQAKDSVGGNSAAEVGSGVTYVPGRVGSGVRFSDTFAEGSTSVFTGNTFINVTGTDTLKFGTGDFSVSAWIYPENLGADAVPNQNYLFWYGDMGTTELGANFKSQWWVRLQRNNDNGYNLVFSTGYLASENNLTATNVPIKQGEWFHLVISRQGATKNVYINGALVGTATVEAHDVSNGPDTSLMLGRAKQNGYSAAGTPGTNFRPLQGIMDEVYIYNYALSDTDVEKLSKQEIVTLTALQTAINSGKSSTNAAVKTAVTKAEEMMNRAGVITQSEVTAMVTELNNAITASGASAGGTTAPQVTTTPSVTTAKPGTTAAATNPNTSDSGIPAAVLAAVACVMAASALSAALIQRKRKAGGR